MAAAPSMAAGEPSLVGREAELALFDGLIERMRKSYGGGVLLSADAGMGKTRLLRELENHAYGRGLRVVRARSGAGGRDSSLALLRELLLGLCDSLDDGKTASNDPAAEIERLRALHLGDEELTRLQRFVGAESDVATLDLAEEVQLEAAAVYRAFLQASAGTGLLLSIDDLHLADAASLRYLERISELAGDCRLLVVATSRPSAEPPPLPALEPRSLGPLDPEAVNDLAAAHLGLETLPEDLVEALVSGAGGNPLHLLELLRALADDSGLLFEGENYVGPEPEVLTDTFRSLPDLLWERLASLSPGAVRMLGQAAILGNTFPIALLLELTESNEDAPALLAECEASEVIEPNPEREGSGRFGHDVMRELILEGIDPEQRQAMHRRVAQAVECGAGGDLVNPAETVAGHYYAAGDPQRAARYFAVAAHRLAARGAIDAAAKRYVQAVDILLELDPDPVTVLPELARLGATATEHAAAVMPDKVEALAERVLTALPASSFTEARAQILANRGEALLQLGHNEEAAAALSEALAWHPAGCQRGGSARTRQRLATALAASGHVEGAIGVLGESLELIAAEPVVDHELMWRFLDHVGRLQWQVGARKEARETFLVAREQAREAGSPVGEARALVSIARAAGTDTTRDEVVAMLSRAMELAHQAGDARCFARASYELGKRHADAGARDEARACFARSLQLAKVLAWPEGEAAARRRLAGLGADAGA